MPPSAFTTKLLSGFASRAPAPTFLSSFFQSPEENFIETETIRRDIVRENGVVAIPVRDIQAGPRIISQEVFTNKEWGLAPYQYGKAFTTFDLGFRRQFGKTEYDSPQFQAAVGAATVRASRSIQDMVQRGIELQAAQVLSSGTISLGDSTGQVMFAEDFKSKATHFPTVITSWATATTDQKKKNIAELVDVIEADGHKAVTKLIFGMDAWGYFIGDAGILALVNSATGPGTGGLDPQDGGIEGASKMGWLNWNGRRLELWVYRGSYIHPQTGVYTKYVAPDHILFLSDCQLDAVFGKTPLIVSPDQRVLPFIPSQVQIPGRSMSFDINAYLSLNGQTVSIEYYARALMLPTEIDGFGRLDVVP